MTGRYGQQNAGGQGKRNFLSEGGETQTSFLGERQDSLPKSRRWRGGLKTTRGEK